MPIGQSCPQRVFKESYHPVTQDPLDEKFGYRNKSSLDEHLDPGRSLISWVAIIWPLLLHLALTTSIIVVILQYIDNQEFNIEKRRPTVPLPDGSARSAAFVLLQSDVTTILSTALAILRLVTACWLGPMCWRCVFILLKATGLTHNQLHRTVSYGIPIITDGNQRAICLMVWLAMVMVLPIHVIAPIMTGSITWEPSYRLTERVPGSTISFSVVASPRGWTGWNVHPITRERVAVSAAGYSNIAWGKDAPGGWSKRVLRSGSKLPLNSTVANVSVPYFSINSIDWIKYPNQSLSKSQLDIYGQTCSYAQIHTMQPECPLKTAPGTLALIPENISSVGNETEPFPNAEVINERRLMVLFSHWREGYQFPCEPVRPANNTNRWISDQFPPDVGFYPERFGGECWAFAWVNFTAGSSDCVECRVSSYSTVQKDRTSEVKPDNMAAPALRIMPTVISMMTLMNSSLPLPWRNVHRYVEEVIGRSYAVSWAALVDWAGESDPRLATEFTPTILSSRANVDKTRVLAWFGLQLLIPLSGIIFVTLQLSVDFPIVNDTTLAAFYLDTTKVYREELYPASKPEVLIKLDYEDGRLKAKLD
ncbi:hypothetical protein RHS03_03413, partial [Rhizoctonia solani]